MEKIKYLYALLYLGLVLNMLIKDKAISIEKKPYGIQTYLRYLANMTNKPEHKNDTMFSIIYHRTHQFVYKKLGRVNKIQLRCVFDIFRFETVDGPRTKINISSLFRCLVFFILRSAEQSTINSIVGILLIKSALFKSNFNL